MLKQMQYDLENKRWNGKLVGELDAAEVNALIAAVQELQDLSAGSMHLDCTELDFIDSMGLGALVKIRKMIEEKGGSIVLTNMKKRIFKLFVITGLQDTFRIEVEA